GGEEAERKGNLYLSCITYRTRYFDHYKTSVPTSFSNSVLTLCKYSLPAASSFAPFTVRLRMPAPPAGRRTAVLRAGAAPVRISRTSTCCSGGGIGDIVGTKRLISTT